MLLMVHGWGLDATLWNPLRAHLPQPSSAVDLGYMGASTILPSDDRLIGIGHSFGALWLLHRLQPRLAGLVLINGFARFTAAPDWPHGIAPRVLARMRTALVSRPAEVVNAFRARCGLPAWNAALNQDALAEGLDALAEWDARAALQQLRIPILCLAAEDDPLIPAALTAAIAALAGAPCRWTTGGHVLPLTQPAWCAAQIAAFVA